MENCMLCGIAKGLVDGYMCSECYEETIALSPHELHEKLWNKVAVHDDVDCGCTNGTHYRLMVEYTTGKARVVKLCNRFGS